MGAFLEKPKTEKTASNGEGYHLRWGVSAMQGWRMEMEDAHTCETKLSSLKNWGFFAVFDGHAGPNVSKYCAQNLLQTIEGNLGKNSSNTDKEEEKVKQAIYQGFLDVDNDLLKQPKWANGEDRGGTTAVCAMVSPKHMIWANCGDSRGLLCRDGKLKFHTVDHKPTNPSERDRIEKAGGTVMMQRVNGSLAVSRALGDFDYKRVPDMKPIEQLVSPEPEMYVLERDEKDQFLLLACDGIYDVMTNDEIIAYVLHHLELEEDLSKICGDLIDTCLNKNSRDNMSVILVTFPSAPKVSKDAIEKEKKLKEEVRGKIEKRLEAITVDAQDPLELEENYIVQQLNTELPAHYDIYSQRPFISEKLQKLKLQKFGPDTDFYADHNLPAEFRDSNPNDGPVDLGMEPENKSAAETGNKEEKEEQPMEEGESETQTEASHPKTQ